MVTQARVPATGQADIFVDVTEAAGIEWTHFSGEPEDRFLIESMGSAAGFLDFDADGRLDILLVNGGEAPRGRSQTPIRNALYRNLGNGRFDDVAAAVGIAGLSFHGAGVGAAGYDNDGFTDVLVTGYPSCVQAG